MGDLLGPDTDAVRRIARRIAGAYLLFASAWIVVSDLALFELTRDLPSFAGASLIKGSAFVLVTTALLHLLVLQHLRSLPDPGRALLQPGARLVVRLNPAVVFGIMAVVTIALVVGMFSYESSHRRAEEHNDLRAIVELKAEQIELLLEQRQAMARSYSRSRGLRDDMTGLRQRPDQSLPEGIHDRVEELRRDLDFDAVLVLDTAGKRVAAAGPDGFIEVSTEVVTKAMRSMASGMPVSNDLHQDARLPGAPILIDYITPLPAVSGHPGIVGALIFREDARKRFFRLVQEWPIPSPTAESLLVRRDGGDVLYLNDVRYAKDTAFRMRRPLDDAGLIAAKVLGSTETMLLDGKDYRGVSVVAVSKRIAGTDWHLIGKIDTEEILAPVRNSAAIWLGSILCMTLLAASGIGILWRQQLRLVAANELVEAARRKRAEDKLTEAEERYRALFERSNDCVFLADFEGNFLDANRAALDLLGYRRDEIPSISFRTLLSPADAQRAMASLAEVVRTGTQRDANEYPLRRKDGGEVIVEVKSSVVFNDGEPSAVLGIAHDVTERRRAQRELEFKNAVLSTQQETSPDAILVVNEHARIISYNGKFVEMVGATEELVRAGDDEPLLRHFVSQIQDPDAFLAKVRHLYEHKEESSYDEIHLKDGKIIDRHSSPAIGPDGVYYGRVWYFRDVTERKRAEAALRDSEARFRAVLEQSIAAVYVIQDDRIVYANPRMREIFGHAPGEPFDPDPLSHVQASARAQVAEQMAQRLTGAPEASYSIPAIRRDGTPFTLGVHARTATYEGRPAIIAVAQDITEKVHAEEKIRHYVAELEQAMQSTINVVATIGELRDPYTHGHERRVGEIAAAIGTEMGLDSNQVEGIRIAGYMHDVGKIAVPAEILAKPARLTKAEFELVKDHAQQSYEILKTVPFPWPVAETAWQHHERLDGSGYPRGLKGEEIILEARILAVADTVEAMSSHRPYRPGLGLEKALVEIEKSRGTLFWPQAVDACLRLFREKAYTMPA